MNEPGWEWISFEEEFRAYVEAMERTYGSYESDFEQRTRGLNNMDMTKYAGSESKYLKASDLQGKRPQVTIIEVNLVEFDDDEKGKQVKPTLKLEGKEKQLVCNATNVEELIRAYGADSERWIGKKIGLSTKLYKNFGKEGIVVTPLSDEDPNDDIPF